MREILKTLDLVPQDVVMIFVGALLFTLLWKALEAWLFLPFLKVVEARESATKGAVSDAAEMQQRADNLMREYNSELARKRVEAVERKLKLLEETKTKAAGIVSQAQQGAKSIIESARSEVVRRESELETRLAGEVDQVVDLVVQKLKTPVKEAPAVNQTLH